MYHDNLYVAATGLNLGNEMTTAAAFGHGHVDRETADGTDQLAVRIVKPYRQPSHLAGEAALDAINTKKLDRRQIGPVYHAVSNPTPSAANAAAHVMTHIGRRDSHHPAVTIINGDQGVIDGLHLAALYLSQPYKTGATYALVSASSVPPTSTSDYWRAPMPLGDGGGALVLSNEWTNLMLVATATRNNGTLGGLRLYDDPREEMPEYRDKALAQVVADVLDDAAIDFNDINYLVTPFGTNRPEHAAGLAGGNVDERELARHIEQGRHVGRLGAADLIAGLHRLRRPDTPLQSGDHILLLADSGGASVGAALLERV